MIKGISLRLCISALNIKHMKKTIFLLGLILILFSACKKDSKEIINYDVKYEVDNKFTNATEFVIRYTQLSADTVTLEKKVLDAYEKWNLSFEAKSGDKIYVYAKIENQSYDYSVAIYLNGGIEKFDEDAGTYSGQGNLTDEIGLGMTLE